MRGDPSPPQTLSIIETANALSISPEHITMLLDRDRIACVTASTGQGRVPHTEVDAYRHRQRRAHAAMRESMTVAETLADDE